MNIKSTIETLLRDGFILVFNQDKLDVVKTAEALVEAGINNMEVTCRIKKPLEKMSRLRKELPDFAMGSASLIDSPQMLKLYNNSHPEDPLPSVTEVVDAGACYLVSAINFSDAGHDTRLRQRHGNRQPVFQRSEPLQDFPCQAARRPCLCQGHRSGDSQDHQPCPHGRNQCRKYPRLYRRGRAARSV